MVVNKTICWTLLMDDMAWLVLLKHKVKFPSGCLNSPFVLYEVLDVLHKKSELADWLSLSCCCMKEVHGHWTSKEHGLEFLPSLVVALVVAAVVGSEHLSPCLLHTMRSCFVCSEDHPWYASVSSWGPPPTAYTFPNWSARFLWIFHFSVTQWECRFFRSHNS